MGCASSKQGHEQQQQQPHHPAPNRGEAINPSSIVVGMGSNSSQPAHHQPASTTGSAEGAANSSNGTYSSAEGQPGGPANWGASSAAASMSVVPGGSPALGLSSFSASASPLSFSPWSAAGASADRNRVLVRMLSLIHEALLDEPQTSESLRLRAQQSLRQTERELAELHAMKRYHGIAFSPSSAPEVALVSSLEPKSPAAAKTVDLCKGDRIIAIEGVQVLSGQHAAMLLSSMLCLPGQTVDLTIQRGPHVLRTSFKMLAARESASEYHVDQLHMKLTTQVEFVESLRVEALADREATNQQALSRAREAEAVRAAAEQARIRAMQQAEVEKIAEAQSLAEEAVAAEASRARKLAERELRVKDEAERVAFRCMMLVLAKVASQSSSSLVVGAASTLPSQGGSGGGLKERLQRVLFDVLIRSGTVEACLYGEEVVPSSGSNVPVLILPNSKLSLSELQEYLVHSMLNSRTFTSLSEADMHAQASAWAADYRVVQQRKALDEEARKERLRQQDIQAQAQRQAQLDMMQRQIAASKAAAVASAMDARRISAAARDPGGWEGSSSFAPIS